MTSRRALIGGAATLLATPTLHAQGGNTTRIDFESPVAFKPMVLLCTKLL